jgi:hypothetical protein
MPMQRSWSPGQTQSNKLCDSTVGATIVRDPHAPLGDHHELIDIPLHPSFLGTLRRWYGRQRLRELSEEFGVKLKVDRVRGVLVACGSGNNIRELRLKLESLTGPAKPVSRAVWFELMRTRLNADHPHAILASLQNRSGCRIHIERNQMEVRLFGPADSMAKAEQLIDELSATCCEVFLPFSLPKSSSFTLQDFASQCSVTILPSEEADGITVVGQRDAVLGTVTILRSYFNKVDCQGPSSSQKITDSIASYSQFVLEARDSKFGSCSVQRLPMDFLPKAKTGSRSTTLSVLSPTQAQVWTQQAIICEQNVHQPFRLDQQKSSTPGAQVEGPATFDDNAASLFERVGAPLELEIPMPSLCRWSM